MVIYQQKIVGLARSCLGCLIVGGRGPPQYDRLGALGFELEASLALSLKRFICVRPGIGYLRLGFVVDI